VKETCRGTSTLYTGSIPLSNVSEEQFRQLIEFSYKNKGSFVSLPATDE
jgi:hypothetical protein